MADNKFLLYELIKNNDKFNPNTEDFQDKQLITRAAFEDMLDTDNYSWSGEKYQQNQFVYEYELDNISEKTKTSIYGLFSDSTSITTTYNKSTQTFDFVLNKDNDYILKEGTDFYINKYDVNCEVIPGDSSTNYSAIIRVSGETAGDSPYEVFVHGQGNKYSGTRKLEVIINKKSISDAEYSYDEPITYNGDPQLPTFTFNFGLDGNGNTWEITSADERMFESTPVAQTDADDYEFTFKVSFQSKNYTGEIPVRWTIEQQSTEISIDNNTIEVDGSGHGLNVTNNSSVDGTIYYVITTSSNWPGNYDSDEQIEANSTITIGNVSTIGTHYIWAYFDPDDDNYSDSGTVMGRLTITEPETIDISGYEVYLSMYEFTYNGSEQTPAVLSVKYGNNELDSTDYDVEDPDNAVDAGTKTIKITGKGNYVGEITVNYKILPKSIADSSIDIRYLISSDGQGNHQFVDEISIEYDGNSHNIWAQFTASYPYIVSLFDNTRNVALTNGQDYSLSTDNVNVTDAGIYYGTISGINNYTDTAEVEFTITKATPILMLETEGGQEDGTTQYYVKAKVTTPTQIHGNIEYNCDTTDYGSNQLQYRDWYDLDTNEEDYKDIHYEQSEGTYYIYAIFVPDDEYEKNYNQSTEERAVLTITEPDKIDLDNCEITIEETPSSGWVYTGNEIKPEITVTYNDTPLTENVDYTVSYSNNLNAGTATISINAIQNSNYTGYKYKTFRIEQATPDITFIVPDYDITYDGEEHFFSVKLVNHESNEGGITTGKLDMVISNKETDNPVYSEEFSINVGEETVCTGSSPSGNMLACTDADVYYAYAKFTPQGTNAVNYKTVEISSYPMTIVKAYIDNTYTVNLEWDIREYNGSEQTPEVTSVRYGNQTLTEGTDYDVVYPDDSTNAGTKTITIKGTGNYDGETTAEYEIEPAESALQISVIGDGKYDGTGSHLLQFFTKLSEYPNNLPGIIHYGEGNYNNDVSINANGAPATASACYILNVSDSPKTINIKFEPTNKNYTTIETTHELTLAPRELDGTKFDYNLTGNQSTFTYDGTQKMPGVTVGIKNSTGTTTVTADNYTIQYGENINAGTDVGTVTIIGKNNLSGSYTLNFTINKANLNCYFKNNSNQIIYNGEEHTFDFQAYTFNDINPTYVGTGTLTYTITHNNSQSQFTEYDVEHNSDLTNWSATNTGTYSINATFTPNNTNYNTRSNITAEFTITPRFENLYISCVENNIERENTGNATMYLDDTLQLYVYAKYISNTYPTGNIVDVSGEQNLTVNVSDDNIISLDNLIVSADDIGTAVISAEYAIYGETHSHTFTINVQELVDLIVSMDSNLTEIPQNDPELHFVYKGGYTGSGNVSSDCFELTDGNNEANIYVYELLEVSDGVSVSRIVGKNITAGTLCDDYDTIQIQGKYNGQSVMGGCWINANRTDQCWIISAESGGGFISEQNNTSPVGSGQFIVEYDTGSKILSSSSVDFTISNGR